MRDFELISKEEPGKVGDTGRHKIRLNELPGCTIVVNDLNRKSPLKKTDMPQKEFNVTDGEGTNRHYELAIDKVQSRDASKEDLEKILDDCWGWLLTHYLC